MRVSRNEYQDEVGASDADFEGVRTRGGSTGPGMLHVSNSTRARFQLFYTLACCPLSSTSPQAIRAPVSPPLSPSPRSLALFPFRSLRQGCHAAITCAHEAGQRGWAEKCSAPSRTRAWWCPVCCGPNPQGHHVYRVCMEADQRGRIRWCHVRYEGDPQGCREYPDQVVDLAAHNQLTLVHALYHTHLSILRIRVRLCTSSYTPRDKKSDLKLIIKPEVREAVGERRGGQ
ncbi:hypothetical protein BJV74DRAFT_122031 [Russula compacta]|nr:hypothetical protein BJV74DRAFT_122031 [Russula compacta]